jgi:hypothetical protein
MSISKVPWTRSLDSSTMNAVSPERQEEEYASCTDCQEETESNGVQLFIEEWAGLCGGWCSLQNESSLSEHGPSSESGKETKGAGLRPAPLVFYADSRRGSASTSGALTKCSLKNQT